MASMLFYQNALPLDKNKHKDITLTRQNSYAFASETNSIPVAGFEFFECSRFYPVFFIKNGENAFIPLALLSLRKKGHDLGEEWKEAYVPAYIRRYPFMLSQDGLVIIDEDAPHFSGDAGDALFTDESEPTETLQEIVRFIESVDHGYKATEEFSKALAEKELLRPFERSVRVGKHAVNLSDLYVIDEKKLHESLSDEETVAWFKKGWIAWSHAHLHSLGAVPQIIKRAEALGVSPVDADAPAAPTAPANDETVQ